jgi:adenylate cyclase
MKYRTKLYIAFLGIALGSTLLALLVSYHATKNQLLRQIHSKVMTVAATTAALLDANLLKHIQTKEDENSLNYHMVKAELLRARDANRREDIMVKYIYTLMPAPDDPNKMLYGVDAEMDPKVMSHIGDVDIYAPRYGLTDHLGELYSPPGFISDPWGIWMSAFAPIRDLDGNYVATLGVDIRATQVLARLHHLFLYQFSALIAAFFAALLGAYFLSRQATSALKILCDSVDEIGSGHLETRSNLETRDEFHDLSEAINHMAQGLQERDRLKINFAHYVSQYILEKILKSDTPMKLEGERRKVTVLFSDIRDFTRLAEQLPPEQVVTLLNQYFERMIDVIFKNYGTLDKFIGDGIMVEFGAPLDDNQQEKHAVQAAIQMHEELKKLCALWEKEGKPTIRMGIGIHTGIAIVGNIGSEQRMEYTAIGDTVNVASRIERATKTLGTPILVSEMTYQAIKGEFPFVDLGPITLMGRTQQITVYTIK